MMPQDGHAAETADLRLVYLARPIDTSCMSSEDYIDHQHVSVDVDALDAYSNAATMLRE
jgi:hypothetical protein